MDTLEIKEHHGMVKAIGGGLLSPIQVLDAKDATPKQGIVWLDDDGDVKLDCPGAGRLWLEGFIEVPYSDLLAQDRTLAFFAAITNRPFDVLPILEYLELVPPFAAEDIFECPQFHLSTVWLGVCSVQSSPFTCGWLRSRQIVEASVMQRQFVPLAYGERLDEFEQLGGESMHTALHLARMWESSSSRLTVCPHVATAQ